MLVPTLTLRITQDEPAPSQVPGFSVQCCPAGGDPVEPAHHFEAGATLAEVWQAITGIEAATA